jgi:hypothetical protein
LSSDDAPLHPGLYLLLEDVPPIRIRIRTQRCVGQPDSDAKFSTRFRRDDFRKQQRAGASTEVRWLKWQFHYSIQKCQTITTKYARIAASCARGLNAYEATVHQCVGRYAWLHVFQDRQLSSSKYPEPSKG